MNKIAKGLLIASGLVASFAAGWYVGCYFAAKAKLENASAEPSQEEPKVEELSRTYDEKLDEPVPDNWQPTTPFEKRMDTWMKETLKEEEEHWIDADDTEGDVRDDPATSNDISNTSDAETEKLVNELKAKLGIKDEEIKKNADDIRLEPYFVTGDEYGNYGLDRADLYYYGDDDILTDEDANIIEKKDWELYVPSNNKGEADLFVNKFFSDEYFSEVYVRNNYRKTDYAIIYINDSFTSRVHN